MLSSRKTVHSIEIKQKITAQRIQWLICTELDYRPGCPEAIKAYDDDNRVLLVSSFSKVLAPGLSVGWIIPGKYYAQVEQQKYITSLTTPVLPQLALSRFLEDGGYDHHLCRIKPVYQQRRDAAKALIRKHFPAGSRTTCPQGGLLLWVELPKQINTLTLSEKALTYGISIAPGAMFTVGGKYQNYFRLCFGPLDKESDHKAIETLGRLAHQLLGNQ